MNLLCVTRDFPPAAGGMERTAAGMAAALARTGHRVRVLAPHGSHPAPGCELVTYRLDRNWHVATWRLRAVILGQVLAFRPDAIIANTWSPCGRAALAAARWRRVPLAIVAHGMDVREPLRSVRAAALQRRTLRRAAVVLAVSRYTKDLLVQSGLTPDHIRIVPNGVETLQFTPDADGSAFRRRHGLPDGFLLLTVARLVAHKGHATVLQALAQLRQRGLAAAYAVVGDGPDRAALAAQAAHLGVAAQVHFTGELPESELPAAYAAADCFVMPSAATDSGAVEGFGIAFLEAAAAGRPAIGGTGTGAADAIADHETGFLVPPGDAGALADAIACLLADPALARRMGAAGRERCLREFGWDQLARKLTGILETLV